MIWWILMLVRVAFVVWMFVAGGLWAGVWATVIFVTRDLIFAFAGLDKADVSDLRDAAVQWMLIIPGLIAEVFACAVLYHLTFVEA